MHIQIECASDSDTILFAGSEFKYYLLKINNSLSFSSAKSKSEESNYKRLFWDFFPLPHVHQMKTNTK